MSNMPQLHIPRMASRRDVLRALIVGAGIYALGPLGRTSVALGAPLTNFKRLVVVNLLGGCDTLNMVVPVGLSQYYAARGSGAISSAAALDINGVSGLYKLHPRLVRVQGLWNQGDALAVQRVGYPQADLSHFVSQDIYSLGVRGSFTPLHINRSGWVARFADQYAPTTLGAVSIGMGKPLDLTVGLRTNLTISSLAGLTISSTSGSDPQRTQATKDLIQAAPAQTGLPYEAKHALQSAYDLADQVQAASTNHQNYLTSAGLNYPATPIGQRLKDVAGMIYAGFDTRLFYTGMANNAEFDTHSNQLSMHNTLFGQLDAALGVFYDEMNALGTWNDVAIVVITEFGRRTAFNGSGTDHGHGFASLVLGGGINGGASKGPDLTTADLATSGTGYLSYAVDFRSIYKELIERYMGVDPAPVFPEPLQINGYVGLI
jgi:uncharacterized protein (DUF1501 family)